MIVRELLTVLGFEIDEANAKKADDLFGKLKTGALAIVGAVTGASAALAALTIRTAKQGDEVAKAAKRIGIGVEELQELEFAAERSGASVADLRAGFRFLQRSAVEAAAGGKQQAATFRQLGVAVKDAGGKTKPVGDLFTETAVALGKLKNENERTALSMRIFGRGATALLPLFAEGEKGLGELRERARELGFVFSEEDAAAAEEFDDAMTDLGKAVDGLVRRLGTKLFPVGLRIVKWMTNWLVANRQLIDRGLSVIVAVVERLVDVGERFSDWIVKHSDYLATMAAIITATLLPALAKLAIAWGIVQAKAILAAAISAAPFLAILAFAAILGAVIDSIMHFLSGEGRSALREFVDEFEKEAMKPESHFMVRTIALILTGFRDGVIAMNTFFDEFFKDAEVFGGITEALKHAFDVAMEYWKAQIREFFGLTAAPLEEQSKARVRGLFGLGDAPLEEQLKARTREFFGIGSQIPGVPATASGPVITVGGSQLIINAPQGGQSTGAPTFPTDLIGTIQEVLDEHTRKTAREVESRVVR